MKFFLPLFRKSGLFLTTYLLLETVIVLFMIFIAYMVDTNLSQVNISPLPFLPLALFLSIKLPAMMHNAFHYNFKRANFLIGEVTSFFVLMSYGIMCINHAFHHAHADTEKDPHAPHEKSFVRFFFTAIFSGVRTIESSFLQCHGRTSRNLFLFKVNILLHHIGIVLRAYLIYLVLGPSFFIGLYVPAFLFYLFTLCSCKLLYARQKRA